LDGFINIEANIFKKKDIWLDLRNGLPFADNSVDSIYSHSFFEHLYHGECISVLKECLRVLKPASGMRIVVPNLEVAIKGYFANELSWVSDFPRHFDSLGGKFYNFIFCDGQHKICFDFSLLEELLKQTGFQKISRLKSSESQIYFKGEIKENADDPVHLYVECFKKEL
jgi:predicted SAM-dependent methyltransferase